jgi:glycosyltransferase involved in cell wall biosynthesis
MKIGIDARMLLDRATGIGRYTEKLIENLAEMDKENEYLILASKPLNGLAGNNPNFHLKVVEQKVFSISEQFALSKIIKSEKLDLFHAPSFVAPLSQSCPSVMTIHDLIHLRFSNLFSRKVRLYYQLVVKPAARKMKRIITDSESSKRDVVSLLGILPQQITVIPLGVEQSCRAASGRNDIDSLLKKFEIQGDFILSVGNRKPHKNFVRLIRSFNLLEKRYNIGHMLVIIVDDDPRFTEIENEIAALHLEQKVKIINDFISREDLFLLYSAADLFVLPSLYEGFGLPALEAMVCGTPVVSSSASSLPEVIGDAGILVGPYDIEEMAECMNRVLADRSLWNELRENGLARIKNFTWEETARRTLEVYKQVYQAGIETRPT